MSRQRPLGGRLLASRIIAVVAGLLGLNYVVWRWLFSVHWAAWWIGVPLVVAETYSLIDSLLFGLTTWNLRRRPAPEPPGEVVGVDVFITTYNEPVDLVMRTALAAQRITYPHDTVILDDGARPELAERAAELGIRVVSRSDDWIDRPRHAKAGNLNNALLVTQGEFILILDADQVPEPQILDRTLGYFADPEVALVQTPQYFVNVPASDPLGSQAPLFYGPIQEGKDGWNAAFFCGSNALIRREALMQLGITGYVRDTEASVEKALRTAARVLDRAIADSSDAARRGVLEQVKTEVRAARSELRAGDPIGEVTYRFQRKVDAVARTLVERDVAALQADLAEIALLTGDGPVGAGEQPVLSEDAMNRLAARDWSPLGALDAVRRLIELVDVQRGDEAQPIMPMATISVTEDMATCMRLHALGWRTVYHDEVLANGLAPEDLQSMLTQRLRWAQGTMQVFFRENPLFQKGLSLPQRLMYFATMWSYLSGFAAVVYVAAPVTYLVFGVLPVQAFSFPFFVRLLPFLIVNQLLFFVVADGRPTWRGQQYSLALFPTWIRATWTAFTNVYFGRSLGFAVTPKTRTSGSATQWRLIRWQLATMVVLVVAAVAGVVRLARGAGSTVGIVSNIVWIFFDLIVFSILIRAARYRGSTPQEPAVAMSERGRP